MQIVEYVLKMKTYTLQELVNNDKVVVYLETETQWQKLKDTGMFKMTSMFCGKYCYKLWNWAYADGSTKTYSGHMNPNKEIVQFEQIIFDMEKKLKHYVCIKAYPGYEVGTKTESSNIKDWPEYWQPVFEQEKIILPFGDIQFTIDKEKGIATGSDKCKTVVRKELIDSYLKMFKKKIRDYETNLIFTVIDDDIQIRVSNNSGSRTGKLSELRAINEAFND